MHSEAKKVRTFSEDEELVRIRRHDIITCAIRVFIEKDYDKTTMADIAHACGMSKGLLYHYVSSKDDILYLIANDQMEGTIRGFTALEERCENMTASKALLEYVNYYYKVVNDTQDYQVFLNQLAVKLPNEDRRILFEANDYALNILDTILKRGVASGEFEIEDTILTAHNIMLIGRSWADRRWYLARRYTFDQYLTIQIRVILKAIQPNKTTDNQASIKEIITQESLDVNKLR